MASAHFCFRCLASLRVRSAVDVTYPQVASVLDFSVQQLLIRIVDCLIVVAVHGYALAGVARIMGDRGPQLDGRLTLNPFGHLDVIGAVALILTQLGWIRPIAIDPKAVHVGRLGLCVCVVVSLAATLAGCLALLALRLPALVFLPPTIAPSVISGLNDAVEMSTWFVVLNLLPLPPLTGAHLLVAIRPSLALPLAAVRLYAGLALGALIATGIGQAVLRPLQQVLAALLGV